MKDAALTEQIRRTYERHPYPAVGEGVLRDPRWRLAPMEWIHALWKPGRGEVAPERILIAGCGTGREAFQISRRFPTAQIVAVDFSPRSIGLARESQRRAPAMRKIRFLVADLTSRSLANTTGRDFDFISCHGVLSYIPNPERVLANLRRCLAPDGALYLGVNGARHHSAGGRELLPAFGFDPAEFKDTRRLRKLLQLCDAIVGNRGSERIANKPAGYLAGDLFGPLIHNLPLADWIRMARQAKLHFLDNYVAHHALRRAAENDFPKLLLGKSRQELCKLVETLVPGGFHRLLFTRSAAVNPPWKNQEALLGWHPVLTGLYTFRLPKDFRSWQALRRVTFKNAATNTRVEYQMPEWELEMLRQSDGKLPLAGILKQMDLSIPVDILRQQLFALCQLLVIQLRPG
jgi:SAM-dependent methyltransferase